VQVDYLSRDANAAGQGALADVPYLLKHRLCSEGSDFPRGGRNYTFLKETGPPNEFKRSRMFAIDRPVLLLDDVVQVLALANADRRFAPGIQGLECRQIRVVFIDRHRLRFAIPFG
jgi:hypothetical protein